MPNDVLNTMTAVAVELRRRGIKATVEYPGFVSVRVSPRRCDLNYGVANGYWQGEAVDHQGVAIKNLDVLNTHLPPHYSDVKVLADLISCDYSVACGDVAEYQLLDASADYATAPLQIPKSELDACSCARGEGRHHPDCPAWDSHTDNYQEAPNAR